MPDCQLRARTREKPVPIAHSRAEGARLRSGGDFARGRRHAVAIASDRLTLEQFLALPETKPALEYEPGGVVKQKTPPGPKHRRLQGIFVVRVASFAEPRRIAMALPELRTTFAGASYVPDVAIFTWDRLPLDASGELADE